MGCHRFALALTASLLALPGCQRTGEAAPAPAPAAPVELTVFAATSLTDALQQLRPAFEQQQPLRLLFNFGSSGDLARQIIAASAADVFLSADPAEMNRIADAGRVLADSRRDILSNQLVVIEPIDPSSPEHTLFPSPFSVAQLRDPRVARLSLANPDAVPAGRYAKAWLEGQGAWDTVRERVVPAVDVRAALAAVESGAAAAGIVYRTDAARSHKVRIVHRVPVAEGPKITYVAAAIAERPHADLARDYADFLQSPAAKAAFQRFGFIALETPPPSRR